MDTVKCNTILNSPALQRLVKFVGVIELKMNYMEKIAKELELEFHYLNLVGIKKMGKRSDFTRRKMDFYATPESAVMPLLPHIPRGTIYCEPCAGEGDLIGHLLMLGGHHCIAAYDAEIGPWKKIDAAWLMEDDLCGAEMIITNPPWDRPVLHQIIERCALLRPTWLLFDADWMHTAQAAPHLEICRKIVSIGRVKWIAGSNNTGMDNCCWYLFDAAGSPHKTIFEGRA